MTGYARRDLVADGQLIVEVNSAVATVTLNAPARLNALDTPMLRDFAVALSQLDADERVRLIVLRAAGRGFCAGLDLGESVPSNEPDGTSLRLAGLLASTLIRCDTPVLAVVQGVAAGMGVSIAIASDYCLAADTASFVLAFAEIGLLPDSGATALVTAAVGRARALRLALTGERIDASTAAEWGLVAETVPNEQLDARTSQLVATLATSAPRAVAATKHAINGAAMEIETAIRREEEAQLQLLASEDHSEGVRAFVERRLPSFEGR